MNDEKDFLNLLRAQSEDTTRSITERREELNNTIAEAARLEKVISIQEKFVHETEELRSLSAGYTEQLQILRERHGETLARRQEYAAELTEMLSDAETLVHQREMNNTKIADNQRQKVQEKAKFEMERESDFDFYVEKAINNPTIDNYSELVAEDINLVFDPQRTTIWGKMMVDRNKHLSKDKESDTELNNLGERDRFFENGIEMLTRLAEKKQGEMEPLEKQAEDLTVSIIQLEAKWKELPARARESVKSYAGQIKALNPASPNEKINLFDTVEDRTLVQAIEADAEIVIEHSSVVEEVRVPGTELSIQMMDVRKYLGALKYLLEMIDPGDIRTIGDYMRHMESLFERVHPKREKESGKYDPDLLDRIYKTANYPDDLFRQYTERVFAEPLDWQNLVIEPDHFKELKIVYETMLTKFSTDDDFRMSEVLKRRPTRMTEEMQVKIMNDKPKNYRNDLLDVIGRSIKRMESEEYLNKQSLLVELSRRYLRRFVPENMRNIEDHGQKQLIAESHPIAEAHPIANIYGSSRASKDAPVPAPQIPKLELIAGGRSK